MLPPRRGLKFNKIVDITFGHHFDSQNGVTSIPWRAQGLPQGVFGPPLGHFGRPSGSNLSFQRPPGSHFLARRAPGTPPGRLRDRFRHPKSPKISEKKTWNSGFCNQHMRPRSYFAHQFLARVFTPRGRRPTTYNPVIWGRRDSRRADNILYIVSKPSDPALPLPPPATATPPPPSASAACHSRLATEHSSAHRRRPAQPHVHSHLPQHSRLHSRLPPATAQGWGAYREVLITRD